MTRDEVVVILGMIKTAYPSFYKEMSKQEMYNTIDLWSEMFKNDKSEIITLAVKSLISKSEYAPSIATIKNEAFRLQSNDITPIELWNKLKKAISNSTYNSVEEYNKLPEQVKRFVGSPNALRDLAQNDATTNDTIVKGQFLKQIENIKAQEKQEKMMLPEIKNVLNFIGKDVNKEIKKINEKNE